MQATLPGESFMAARKRGNQSAKQTAKKRTGRGRSSASSEYTASALPGRASRGREWDPSQPEAQAAALPEVNEPRPYLSRYPIPDEEFRALKQAAPKVKLPQATAEKVKDKPTKKEELSALAAVAVALA